MKQLVLIFWSLAFGSGQASLTSVEGILLERGTRAPLAEVNIFWNGGEQRITTDAEGRFRLENVKEGAYQVVVNSLGYRRLETTVEIDTNTRLKPVTLFLERETYSGKLEALVVGKQSKRDNSRKSLLPQDFATVPGAGSDPVKAVQNLPGVNRVAGFSSQVVIQGSAPSDTKYDLDGHEIPLVFHFGGLTSVVMPEAVGRVDYLSAGYSSEYSRALGGVVSLKTRNPELGARTTKGFFFVDSLKSGGLVEGKINEKSEYLLSARYSYIGFILRQALKDNEQLNLTVAPEFSDLTAIYTYRPQKDEELKIASVASKDTLEFLFKEPVEQDPSVRGTFSNETSFYRLIPQWSRTFDTQRTARLSAALGQDRVGIEVGDRYFRLNSQVLSVRGEWDQALSSAWRSQWGFDNNYANANVAVRLPILRSSGGINNPISTSETKQVDVQRRVNSLGLYWRNEISSEASFWTYQPQIRLDYFNVTKESLIGPRLSVRYQPTPSLFYKLAGGLYHQAPQPQQLDDSFGNPEVKSPRAWHATLGLEKDFRENSSRGWSLNSSLFWRDFYKLVVQSESFREKEGSLQPEFFNNEGRGKAYGWEVLLRGDFAPWTGWLSYTLSRSTRWQKEKAEEVFEFDQTHNFNLVGSYDFPRDWKLGGRLRYVTGNPSTPIIGARFDSDNDVYIPIRGPIYSERFRDFFQIDLRLDKKIVKDKSLWSVYLDIQNILNSQNPESIRYSYDYSQKEEIVGLPILPSFGVKGEF
jgi:hypothetical protein